MSAAADTPAPRRRRPIRTGFAVLLAVLALLGLLLAGVRYAVLAPQVRSLIETATDGLKVSRFGRLKIEGLTGDIWSNFGIRKLTLCDANGVWIEADNVHMTWTYDELLRRRFHAKLIDIQTVKVLRRPILSKKAEDTGQPVSVLIDQAHARVEMLPQFSYERGVYDLGLGLDVERNGDMRGQARAASVLHPGDYLNVDFDLAKTRPLMIRIDGVEAQGGALAGSIGLPAKQPFLIEVTVGGKASQGQFTAIAASGATQPLKAQGAWTKTGGVAHGMVLLTASSLTAPYAERFGPKISFVLAGQSAGRDLFALDGRVAAENLKARVTGLGDIGERRLGPQGLQLTAESAALSRITGGPQIGPARVAGRVTQAKAAWRFAGTATASRASFGGYGLDQASGPVEIAETAGQWDVKARLAGAGGRGSGYVAAMLGGAPRASFDGARLADGRLLLRDLQVAGAGLKLDATGGRGLLGGLTFKGKAAISNLAVAHPGAAGAAQASWSAGQARAGQPWTFSLDAQGDRLATGYPELDRLLGGKPQLKAQASLLARRLTVAQANLNGAAVNASASGALAPDGALAFKLDWSAQGPFRAGPIEIAGQAKGSGEIAGTLAAPRADLAADLASIDVPRLPLKDAHLTLSFQREPDGSSGMAALTATSAYGPADARTDFRFPEGGVDLTGLSLDAGGVKASGALSLRRAAPSAANLEVAVTHGAFLDAGKVAGTVRIAQAPGSPHANLNLTAENVRLEGSTVTVRAGKVTADGPLDRLPYVAQATGVSDGGAWGVNGRGVFSDVKPGYAASFDGQGRLGGRELRTAETAQFRFGGPEQSARLKLIASDGGRVDLDGRLNEDGTDIHAQLTSLTLGLLDEDLAGKTDATLSLQGRGARLDGTLEAKLTGARGRGTPAASGIDGVVRGKLGEGALTLDMTAANAQGLTANASVVLPTEASAAPFRIAIARQKPLSGKFAAQGEIRPLWDLLVGGERSLAGKVVAQGTLGGTLNSPNAAGQISVEGGRFDDGATGLSLRNVALTAGFAQDAVSITQASGVDGHGGSVAGTGRISLVRDGVSSFRLDLKGFRLIDNDLATASATGQATVNRTADGKVRLAGALTIDRADVAARVPTPSGVVVMDVVEKNRPADLPSGLPPPTAAGNGWALDVTLKANRGVFLKGHGLDAELSLNAHVGGTTAHPDLSGTARVVRGDYDFAGQRFEFDTSGVVYLSTKAEQVRLDLTATRDDPTLTASVRIRGTAARPEISLSSTPTLPSDEVLSQVLFGRTASQLSPIEAAQLASALSSLAGGGGFDVIGNLRTFAGLDRLAVGGGDATSGAVSVSGGKYLTDNVYLELTGGGRDGGAAQVEWRVKKNLSILSRVGGQGAGRLAVRWRKDY
ncbi:MAG TPA: translocation/assembly module TamB domain-containing protein [Phenylobacterium sp.]|uniref:translocation/assembly module TamB domain-containing protein n=1 Tax=Phenylobacterium sp. TaxID=1871053 RepID=UPI002D65532E|nr:translocation/assembly module TamB domain-containing protein [Phenylobacterium sp.]HZZ68317.1 translocation/assembly module TamB domain-containing protein [Phenylobacterium sp.]